MHWYHNLSFRNKLVYPSLALFLSILLTAFFGIRSINQLEVHAVQLANQYLPNQDLVLQADKDIVQVQSAERSMLFLTPSSERFQEQVHLQTVNLKQAFDRVSKLSTDDPQVLQQKQQFLREFATWKQKTQAITQLLQNDSAAAKAEAVEMSFGPANKQFWALRTALDGLIEPIVKGTSQTTELIAEQVLTTDSILVASAVLSLAICLVFVLLIPNLVGRSITAFDDSLQDITRGEGDLSRRLSINSEDEFGQLADGFNQFLQNLQRIIQQVMDATVEIAATTNTLNSVSRDAKDNMQQQRSSTQSVAAATEQLNSNVKQISLNARAAAEQAKAADTQANDGQQVVNQTINIINHLSNDITSAKGSIERLESDTQTIGQVLDVITSIAEQTNLLALNAAIEAARAGEQGRGFAVVADEVRSLAAKTQQSTEEIKAMIETLQRGSRDAVETISISHQKMTESVTVVSNADEALNKITKAVSQIQSLNTQIATSAEQQTQATDDINDNIRAIAEASTTNLNNAEKVSVSSHQLDLLANTLSTLVSRFKL